MKGIVLAGGIGSRLLPLTLGLSKQLMPVYDKPMIYYPISTLMLAGITDILVVTAPQHSSHFAELLGDGSQWGIRISYQQQARPRGIADALLVAEEFLDGQPLALILGDNLFHGVGLGVALRGMRREYGATILAHQVSNPQAYGVIEFDDRQRPKAILEKPSAPKSNWAIPGLYFFDSTALSLVKTLKPSSRGELEITDLINLYLKQESLDVVKLERGTAWLDTGSFETLLEAGNFVRIMETRQGTKIGCPEEIAWRMGKISDTQLRRLGGKLQKSGYGEYLLRLLDTT